MKSREIVVTGGHVYNSYDSAKNEETFQKSEVEAIIEHRRM